MILLQAFFYIVIPKSNVAKTQHGKPTVCLDLLDGITIALSLSASTIKKFNDIKADQKSLTSLSFNICSLWGIDIKKLIKNFSESKNKNELKGKYE